MKLIIASNNAGKIKEFKEMLTPLGYEPDSKKEAVFRLIRCYRADWSLMGMHSVIVWG